MRKQARLLHKWLGLFSFCFILVVSSTALIMNHEEILLNNKEVKKEQNINLNQIKSLTISPNKNLIVASDLYGLFKSIDKGTTWKELKLFVPSENIEFTAFSPENDDIFVVAIKDKGVFITDDGGEVWDEIKTPFDLATENIQALSFSKDMLLLKTQNGLYKYFYKTEKWEKPIFQNKQNTNQIKEIVYNLHTGSFFGNYGIYLYDLISGFLILLSLSGIYLSFRIKKKKPVSK